MKSSKYIILLGIILSSCKKNIDLYPLSNSTVQTYYSTTAEVQTALVGAYNGMQKPLLEEWKLTELRSDNTLMGSTGTTSAPNLDLTLLDIFTPPTSHQGNYNYWISSYYNIRNVNTILNSLSINYNDTSGVLNYDNLTIPVSDADRKNIAAEATFIRAYHYFNLVRLYGGVFLIHEPIDPIAATLVNRTSVSEIYKLIISDLKNSVAFGNATKFTSIASANLGRANKWCAEALLAKAYLSTGVASDKALAIPLLQDVIANSGYSLQISYPNIFSTSNEMNSEIMFAIRYKAGGLGLGSTFPNTFAPENSGSAIVNGDRDQITMAIHNLVENAINYSPDATRVAIGVNEADGICEISVSDQGIGIPEKDLERIFERFYRVDAARSRITGGTGLGLSIVKHVVTNHGGDISVWSVEGAGSTFTIRLPLANALNNLSNPAAEAIK